MSVSDPLSQTFDNSRLTYAWITDEHRVILGAPGQDLHQTFHHILPADHRIKTSVFCHFCHIPAEFLQHGFFCLLLCFCLFLFTSDFFQLIHLLLHHFSLHVHRLQKLCCRTLIRPQDSGKQIHRLYLFPVPLPCRKRRLIQHLVRLPGYLDRPGVYLCHTAVIAADILLQKLLIQPAVL